MSAGGPSPGPGRSVPPSDEVRATVAGWTVAVSVRDASLAGSLRRTLARFPALESVAPSAWLEVQVPESSRPPPAVRELPVARREQDGSLRISGEDYSAWVSPDRTRATVVGAGMFPVETVLKVMLAAELARRGGLLIHGVGVAHQGRAALFVGHSGAGKSTLGTLWREAGGVVLADELVAVWPESASMGARMEETLDGDGWRAAGTPWNLLGSQVEASLRAVGTLAWDSASRWEGQGAGEVARVLLLNALLPETTASGRSALIASAGRLLSGVETARLVFARDASASAVLRARLGAAGG